MIKTILDQIRGVVSLAIYVVNTVFWVIPIFIGAILKLLIPVKSFRKICDIVLNGSASNWVWVNSLTHKVFCDIRWHVFGLESLKPDDWYLIVANHQSWVDILVLQTIFHNKAPFLKFFLKKELFWFPIIGQAWWALDFPFMKRYSRKYLEKHPHLKGRDLEITKKACEKFKTVPISVMNFVEGTRFSESKRDRQKSPHKNLLRPRAGGIAFVLAAMGEHLNSFIDVTIAYPGGPKSFWAFLCGNVRDIRVRVNALPITQDMLGDYFNDAQFRETFQNWVNAVWTQKEQCISDLLAVPEPDVETGAAGVPCFPKVFSVPDGVFFREEPSV